MKAFGLAIILFGVTLNTNAQNTQNSYPEEGNVTIKQASGSFRSYDVINFNNHIVARLEATTDGSGQLWVKDQNGNYKMRLTSNDVPSSIAGELVIGQFTDQSKGSKLYVNGNTRITGDIVAGEILSGTNFLYAYGGFIGNHGVTHKKVLVNGWDNSTGQDYVGIYVAGNGAQNANEKIRINYNGNVGIGTTTPDAKLTVAGNIHSREVKVTVSAGADFVFEPDYKLKGIEETAEFIKNHKHLPEIPSEKEMIENGLELGEMNIKLLQKVEELTLYLIEQNKRIEYLESKIKDR